MATEEAECSTPATTTATRKGPAVRSHCEAERKRRQRINAHLATLRTLVPSASRMDKAALLGEVVRHVRELRAKASHAAGGVVGGAATIPGECDEVVVVEDDDDDAHHRRRRPGGDHHRHHCYGVRAWVCCADRPGLLSDLGRAVRSASARPVRAEIATVGGRTRSALELDVACADDGGGRAVAVSRIRAVLRGVLLDGGRDEEVYVKRTRFSPEEQVGEVQ
ncbi:hypothetical protein PR202_gb02891 [Eleusine coracana subsp. coracana]|uniref:BHLH domain-containing protein n=1 Tax=Eleusine coracana subsp. coracana TaxID=191504 RepID=A0AAV5DY70_ELECO|nr:hypothetical protein QOZ80_8BG0663450 [Eleusine coracana subsp. coracana]GJN15943.1 hypothetical protein PR202_gb02891 [Eleusine coracana subsp. coracana]